MKYSLARKFYKFVKYLTETLNIESSLKVLGDKPVKILILIPPFYLPTYYQYTQTLNIESSLRVLSDKPVHIFIFIPPFYLPTYYQFT